MKTMTLIEYYEDQQHNKFLVIPYNNRVDYCKVSSDGSQTEPTIRTTKADFQIFRANQNWVELNNVHRQEQMKGLVKLYKIKGESNRICAIHSGGYVQWSITIEGVPQNWLKTSNQSFEGQWKDKLEEDVMTQ